MGLRERCRPGNCVSFMCGATKVRKGGPKGGGGEEKPTQVGKSTKDARSVRSPFAW